MGLTAALAAYTAGAGHLWDAGLWPDILFISLVLFPVTLGLIWLALPLAFTPGLLPAALVLAALSVVMKLADLDVLFNLTKLFALTFFGFWFLSYFETVAWAVLVAVIIPWVDIWSVFFGPTGKITSDHPSIFERISIAFREPGGLGAANLGPPDILFFALFVAAARRFGLRPGWTWLAMTGLIAGTLILAVQVESGLPALPAVCVRVSARERRPALACAATARARARAHLRADRQGLLRPRRGRDRAWHGEGRPPDARAAAGDGDDRAGARGLVPRRAGATRPESSSSAA